MYSFVADNVTLAFLSSFSVEMGYYKLPECFLNIKGGIQGRKSLSEKSLINYSRSFTTLDKIFGLYFDSKIRNTKEFIYFHMEAT